MSAYDNDPRVRRANDIQYDVHGDDKYLVTDLGSKGCWIDLSAGSNSMREAVLLPPQDRLIDISWGPHPSVDDAIRLLIGDPRG